MESEIVLRAATADDGDFLFALLRAALGPYVEATYGPWDEDDQRARFFAANPIATHEIVESAGRPIGCVDLRRLADEVKLNRVLLLPELQNRGIGSLLMRGIIAEAEAAGLPVRLQVMKVNPAQRFYRRLGFAVTGETETHILMEHPAR